MKKIVVFGGGTGLSCILSGLKLFPLDVTTVITVSDNGSSTGRLRQELNIPAVGDVGKVLLSMANTDDDFIRLLQYRFDKDGSLHNHPVRNVMLAALIDIKGNITEATKYMCRLLNVSGTVLPLTEEGVDLVGVGGGRTYFGEEEVSRNIRNIETLSFDHEIHVNPEILEKIADADLIILSPGSLYTSIIPHLLSSEIITALNKAKAPIMYVSNLVTQPGETDGYRVSDHIRVLNSYLGGRKIDYVLSNVAPIDPEVLNNYERTENKIPVVSDFDAIQSLGTDAITGNLVSTAGGSIRHDPLRTAYMIFSFLME